MMIVTVWVIYCVVIGIVLGAGAVAWERAARWSQRPARWGWLAALAGAVTLPWVLRLVPDRGWEAVPGAASALRLELRRGSEQRSCRRVRRGGAG